MPPRDKLIVLMESTGHGSIDTMLESATFDGVSPGICMNEKCNYTTTVEPDQAKGYCEICGTQTVQSALIIAGII